MSNDHDDPQRTVLPIPDRPHTGLVQIETGEENADHLVHPEDRLRIIMARQ